MKPIKTIVTAAATLAVAGIAAASIDIDSEDTFYSFDDGLHAFPAVTDSELPPEALAVHDLMVDPGTVDLDTPFCEVHDALTTSLARDFGETRQPLPASNEATATEIWASGEFGTWTLVEVQPDGVACVVASGIGWTDSSDPAQTLQLAQQL